MMFQKFNYTRDKKRLKAVASLPCQLCFREGQTQASHSNQSTHGKCMAKKASDEFTAALCQSCHHEIDQGHTLTKTERDSMWNLAYKRTEELLNA